MPEKENRAKYHAIKSKFLTLPGEELILVQRKHWLIFVFPILSTLLIGFLAALIIFVIALPYLLNFLPLVIAAAFVIIITVTTITLKSIVDWYLNVYVITNRKITEVSYRPLAARNVSEVLLDQVKCTEIDTRVEGIMNEFLDIGDVIITFDRPTHEEEFVLTYVKNPQKIETHLQKMLSSNSISTSNNGPSYNGGGLSGKKNLYIKRGEDNPKWRYMEESGPVNIKKGGETLWNM